MFLQATVALFLVFAFVKSEENDEEWKNKPTNGGDFTLTQLKKIRRNQKPM